MYHPSLPMAANSRASAMHRPVVRIRIEKQRSNQARALWWWSRHGTWSTLRDEDIEDRMQKYQKIMRYRYSRALKRKAMWDRENSPPMWFNRGPSKWLCSAWERKYISTTDNLQARLKDDDPSTHRNDQHWDKAHRDFEAFKAEVDRAIAKDPVGFLFGRRLQGPPSSNNSSWTSFARIFDSKESQESFEAGSGSRNNPKRIKIETMDFKRSTEKTNPAPKSSSKFDRGQQPSESETSYIFDPITGRNVPQHSIETEKPKSFTERVFDSLFSEHVTAEDKPLRIAKATDKAAEKGKFENSRDYDYRQLRSKSIGNSIDTTAEFGGKYHVDDDSENSRFHSDIGKSSEGPDDVPPFTGTTYEQSHTYPSLTSSSTTSWLEKEGFRVRTPANTVATNNDKLQPSLDRMQSDEQAIQKKYTTKLQPAIERVNFAKPRIEDKSGPPPLQVASRADTLKLKQYDSGTIDDRREDLDLLRPSDVRAATKTVRTTRVQQARDREVARNKLEADFVRRQTDTSDLVEQSSNSSHRLTRALLKSTSNNIIKHVEKYPDGVMAKIARTIVAPIPELESSRISKFGSIDDTFATPSSILGKPSTPCPSNQDLAAQEVASVSRSQEQLENTVRQLSEQARAIAAANAKSFIGLATSLRDAYESERGPIGTEVDHALRPADEPIQVANSVSPLKTATVKPGVHRYPCIERHTHEFEPKLIAMRERAKDVKRNLYDIGTAVSEIKTKRAKSPSTISTDAAHVASTPASSEHKLSIDYSTHNSSLASDEKQRLRAMRALNDRIKREPQLLEKPVLRPQRASQSDTVREDGSLTSSSTPLQAPRVPSSPYVLLTYNKSSGEVDRTELADLIAQDTVIPERVNPIAVMSNLNYPAAFVSHFAALEKAGYKLASGGGDLLVFQKDAVIGDASMKANALRTIQSIKSDINEFRNRIAAEEAGSQPSSKTIQPQPKSAATVLDEIPVSIPLSTPEAPGAPSTPSATYIDGEPNIPNKKSDRKSRRIRRQEQVFSGTLRPSALKRSEYDQESRSSSRTTDQPGLLERLAKAVRRAVLTVTALGIGAYTIGIIAEGIGAHAQAAQGVAGVSNEDGPRKKVVMPIGQRPGIYSTESSRNN